ncbi:AAA-domain-containing protein, partial [Ramicandelaber brevisporus]
ELPAPQLEDRWESLVFDDAIPQRLLDYTITLASFSDRNVDQSLVSWNRVALLHGEPGTGKTTLCKALAQKAAIRLGGACALCEVNTHSLFSKWFSESGKLVKQAFSRILTEIEADRIFVLVDEVESLTASRAAAANSNGAEPTDAIRVVNAVLTELDRLARDPRVIVLTTSNITGAIDAAFVDRADIKQYIGPPSARAIYAILVSCIQELAKRGIINDNVEFEDSRNVQDWMLSDESRILKSLAERCVGMSGRTLRRLPFIATALF